MVDLKRCFTSLADIAKNFFWETQFLEIIITWTVQWKWTLFVTSVAGTFAFIAINITLMAVIPVAEGEYKFRDITLPGNEHKWRTFTRYEANRWKNHMSSYRIRHSHYDDADDVELGNYEVTAATVYRYALSYEKNTSIMEPIDHHLVTLLCQKKGRPELYLAFEKTFGVPRLKWLKGLFGEAKKSGVHVQLSDSRDGAVTSTREWVRPILDVGKRRWRRKKGSKISVERMLDYYTQTSSDLSAAYHVYYSNSRHFSDAVIKILEQMQNDDLGNDVKSASDESHLLHSLFQVMMRCVVQLVL